MAFYPVKLKHYAMPKQKINKAQSIALCAFGNAVRQRRKQQGYSQEAFGDACGIHRSYMGGIERGEHNLALINILKIIDALNVKPSEFFSDLDDLETQRKKSKTTRDN